MGCDIHAYVEYRRPGTDWWSFGRRINPGRNYRIFGRLTNGEVRWSEGRTLGLTPRGIPDDIAAASFDDWWLWIDHSGRGGVDGSTTPERATRYHEEYGRRYRGDYKPMRVTTYAAEGVESRLTGVEHDGKPTHVEHPDWHTPSWLTPDEWERAIGDESYTDEYRALLAAMRVLERAGHDVRVVFWFDN